jgi:ABC-type uncharacterized transport system substrate-binding protein
MRRREFITLLGAALATWPIPARSQPTERMRRIGILFATRENDPDYQRRLAAFRKQLDELGWIEGRNIQIDHRWASGDVSRTAGLVSELIAITPDVVVATNTTTLVGLQQATRTIPIVFANVTDPVGLGFVESLARPGGNITGFTNREYAMAGKWLEMLKEAAPGIRRVAVLHNPENPASVALLHALETGPSLGVQISASPVMNGADIEYAVESFASAPNGGLIVLPDGSIANYNRDLIVKIAAAGALPAIFPGRDFVQAGGLMSYGHDPVDLQRQSATYVDRILRGEKPADLPVQAATKFELVINLKVAKALGLTIPPALLARADEVIE